MPRNFGEPRKETIEEHHVERELRSTRTLREAIIKSLEGGYVLSFRLNEMTRSLEMRLESHTKHMSIQEHLALLHSFKDPDGMMIRDLERLNEELRR